VICTASRSSSRANATAPEIALALSLGAEIEILNGVVIPWLPESPCIFQKAIRDLRRRREEHKPKTILNEMFKQLGNGIYGKLGQGIKGTTAYNTGTDTHEEIGKSKITNPDLAAHVTGLIRALLGELIASAGTAWAVISATTDSIVTNCQFSEVNLTGPVASYMIRLPRSWRAGRTTNPAAAFWNRKARHPGSCLGELVGSQR
jgi:hypothetical protein